MHMDTYSVGTQMKTYTYSLQKYRNPSDKHTCPQCGRKHCFKYYVDHNNEPLDERVGYCDHQSSCGYNYTPRQYFADNPDRSQAHSHIEPTRPSYKVRPLPQPADPSFLDEKYVSRSLTSVDRPSDLVSFMLTLFDAAIVSEVCRLYRLGMTHDGRTIFWQIDAQNRVRTGLIMRYNADGHRDRLKPGAFNWAHSVLTKRGEVSDFNLRQCLFGEHLLTEFPDKEVALVEGAKSALIGTAYMPEYVWVATCGKNQFKPEVLSPLRGRKVTVYPDIDGYAHWKKAAPGISAQTGCASIKISGFLEYIATDEQRAAHIDIADLIVDTLRP